MPKIKQKGRIATLEISQGIKKGRSDFNRIAHLKETGDSGYQIWSVLGS